MDAVMGVPAHFTTVETPVWMQWPENIRASLHSRPVARPADRPALPHEDH
jgi:hypothetical protein